LADEQVEQPTVPDVGRPPGWYPVPGDMMAQSYWDGEGWSARRRWNGGMWVADTGPPTGAGTLAPRPGRPAAGAKKAGRGRSRRGLALFAVALVVAAGVAAVVVTSSRSSHNSTSATSSSAPATSGAPAGAPATSHPVATSTSVPAANAPAAALVAACQADAQSVVAAVQAYQAKNGGGPSPPSPWSASTYAANFAPLTSSAGGGPFLRGPPGTTHYVIEYDAAGHVWVAPAGTYQAAFNAGQSFDGNASICLAAVG